MSSVKAVERLFHKNFLTLSVFPMERESEDLLDSAIPDLDPAGQVADTIYRVHLLVVSV